jgi:peptidoglycan/xylan/chitin deacetylase (PgdA/CDA1 family)
MGTATTKLMQLGMASLQATGLGALLAPLTRGKGVIFTLHSVRPEPPEPFEPNRILKVTPQFLEETIAAVQKAGYEIVSLAEAARRLKAGEAAPPVACFTFDDGYRDNYEYAYPIFKKHGLPFAIYVPTDYVDGKGDLWWLVLEAAIRKASSVRAVLDGVEHTFPTGTVDEKERAHCKIYWHLRAGSEAELRAAVRRIAEDAGYDASSLCRDLIMTWDELRALAADPLVTIGAHTRRHLAVAKLSDDEARAEIAESVARIERELGRTCRHFSFPYGDATSAGPRDFALCESLGLETAVTTRKDVLREKYALTGLPRASLNGDFQRPTYVRAMMTGVPFMVFDAATAMVRPIARLMSGRRAPASGPVPAPHPGAAST